MQGKERYIMKIDRNCELYKRKILKNTLLNSNETMCLHYIRHNIGISQNELAKMLEVDKALVSRIINKLLKLELITKEVDENNHKYNKIYPTEKAQNLKIELNNIEKDFYDYLYDGISKEQLDIYFKVLEEVYIKSKKARKNNFYEIKRS